MCHKRTLAETSVLIRETTMTDQVHQGKNELTLKLLNPRKGFR